METLKDPTKRAATGRLLQIDLGIKEKVQNSTCTRLSEHRGLPGMRAVHH